MSNIQLSQPGGRGTLATDGHIELGARCLLSPIGVLQQSWTILSKPAGSAAVARNDPKQGWYFDPDVGPGKYTIQLTDSLSATHTNTFTVIVTRPPKPVLDIRDFGAVANENTATAAAKNALALYSAGIAANAAGGGSVYISGIFYVTVPYVAWSNFANVNVFGDGRHASQLIAFGGPTTDTSDPGTGNGYAFLTFYSPTNCHVRDLGFRGAGVWPPLSTPPTIVSRKGVMFREPSRCTITYCYFESLEGEAAYCDASATCNDVHFDNNEFKNCLSNCLNIGISSNVGNSCSANNNTIEGLIQSAFQGGGIDVSCCYNVVRPGVSQPVQGGDVFLLVASTGARLEGNEIFDMDISQSGVSFFSVGDAYGSGSPGTVIKHASIRGNKMTRCKINNTVAGKQAFISLCNINGTTDDVAVEGNLIAECTSNGAGAIAIRAFGAGMTGKVTFGPNVIRPSSNVTIGYDVDATVTASAVAIVPGSVFNSIVTTKWNLGVGADMGADYVYQLAKVTDPAAPAANGGRVYIRDNGGGKMQLVVRFPTGAVQVIATEP